MAKLQDPIAQHLAAVKGALKYLREAEQHEKAAERRVDTARQVTAHMRLALGRELVAARGLWPTRGPKAKGWGEFLRKAGVDQPRAWECMKYAGYVEKISSGSTNPDEILPTLAEAGLDPKPRKDDLSPGVEPDRDSWCTPKWLTGALGSFDLDPCANERSHVQATTTFRLDRQQDGLQLARTVPKTRRVFINPPYSNVMPWIEAYAHTRFCFLLKIDASTKWFAALHEHSKLICVPQRTRIEFEAPSDVEASSNQFPHGLFFAHERDASAAVRKLSYVWRIVR